ncbi:hypothetical protein LDENG_00077870 [Lucifuga dentata]|nr:hypothetical protein LDENG_00077870 [Lucifuga dentata]
MKTKRHSHISPVLASLHWLPVSFSSVRSLRSANHGYLAVLRSKLKTRGDHAFTIAVFVALHLWNSFPQSLRGTNAVHIFKKQLKAYLFSRAFL